MRVWLIISMITIRTGKLSMIFNFLDLKFFLLQIHVLNIIFKIKRKLGFRSV